MQPVRANVCKAVQEPNQELNEEGKSEFLSKINTPGNTSNAKEDVNKIAMHRRTREIISLRRQIMWRGHRMKRSINQVVLMMIHMQLR